MEFRWKSLYILVLKYVNKLNISRWESNVRHLKNITFQPLNYIALSYDSNGAFKIESDTFAYMILKSDVVIYMVYNFLTIFLVVQNEPVVTVKPSVLYCRFCWSGIQKELSTRKGM